MPGLFPVFMVALHTVFSLPACIRALAEMGFLHLFLAMIRSEDMTAAVLCANPELHIQYESPATVL